ncbi:hypothetical protein [Pseudoalteromonas xiamenensis]
MKVTVKKIKNLSVSNSLPFAATPAVTGGVISSCGVECGCGGGDRFTHEQAMKLPV